MCNNYQVFTTDSNHPVLTHCTLGHPQTPHTSFQLVVQIFRFVCTVLPTGDHPPNQVSRIPSPSASNVSALLSSPDVDDWLLKSPSSEASFLWVLSLSCQSKRNEYRKQITLKKWVIAAFATGEILSCTILPIIVCGTIYWSKLTSLSPD